MLSKVVVLCAVLGVAFAALGIAKQEAKPDKYKDIEGCYIKKLDAVIPLGEARPSLESCMEYRCGKEWVQYVSCGAVGVSQSQILVQDLKKPYPGCCPRVRERIQPAKATEVTDNKL